MLEKMIMTHINMEQIVYIYVFSQLVKRVFELWLSV